MTRRDWLPTMWSDWGEDESSPFYALKRQIDSVLEDFDKGGLMKAGTIGVRTNVSETETEVRLTAELPGITRDEVEIEISGDRLTLKGEKTSEDETTGKTEGREFHRLERRSGHFERMIRLPFEIDPDRVLAEMKDGVLTVTVPKPAEVAKAPHKVAIKHAA